MTRRPLRSSFAPALPLAKPASRAPALKPVAAAVGLALLSFHMGAGWVLALPTDGQVQAGTATVQQPNSQTLIVNQTSPRVSIQWPSFSIATGESVVFRQPSSTSVALNLVTGANPSLIFGTLQANGQIFLINPSGVLFGRGAQVDVGSIVASTLAISTQDFMAGRYAFNSGVSAGSVVNQGTIRAAEGGYVALLGNQVSNTGTIAAQKGSVALGAGESMLLDFNGDGLLNLKVNTAAAGARIDHGGLIQADGGRVIMNAQAKNALLGTVLNVEGVVMARGLTERNGAIYLDGGRSGVTSVTGMLDASSTNPGQRGGDIRVLGEYVGLFGNATLDASGPAGGGTVLVGGDFQGRNPDIPNARETIVDRNARVLADATEQGDGGKVIVWADGTNRYFGSTSVRGGPQGGDGGFVEVSGKAGLLFRGRVDATAPQGKMGTLLLDPDTITIRGGDGDGDSNESNASFSGSGIGGTVQFGDTGPTAIFESEIEEQSKTASISIDATRSILIDGAQFTHNSGNPGDSASGVLALAANSSLSLRTRNNGAAESGTIDLVTGGFHGNNLRIVTSGNGGSINVQSGAQLSGNQATNIRLPQLSGAGSTVSVFAAQGGTIDVAAITLAPANSEGHSVFVSSQGAAAGAVSIPGGIDARGTAAPDVLKDGGSVLVQGQTISVAAINTSGGNGTAGRGGNAGPITLTSTGNTTLTGDITATGGSATSGNANGGAGGAVTFSGPVVLGSNVSIRTAGGLGIGDAVIGTSGAVTFFGTIDADAAANNRTLTINSFTGTTSFSGNIGNTQALADLDVTAGTIAFQFAGSGPATPITANLTAQGGNTVTFTGPVTLGTDTTFNTGSNNVTFGGTVESAGAARNLVVNSAGTTTFAGAVGNGNGPLASLTTDAPGTTAINGGAVTTTGSQTYNDPVTLGADAFFTSLGGNSITFASTVQSPGTPRNLNVQTSGTTTFGGVVGGNNNPLQSLTTGFGGTFTTVINGGAITTVGDQTYNDAVVLGAPTTLNSTTGNITFAGTLTAGANALTITSNGIDFNGGANAVSGSGALVLQPVADNVSIGIGGAAGTLGLSAADIAALANGFGSITIGRNTGTGTTTVNAVTFSDPVTLRQPGTGGGIVLNGPLTGADNASVTLVAGSAITLNGDVTTNNQAITLNGPVNGTGTRNLNAGTGNIDVLGTVNGGFNLLTTSTGTTTFGSAIGGVTPLTSFTAAGAGTLAITGPGITTTGNQTFSKPVTIGANTTFTSSAGSITFATPVNADAAANNRTLTLNGATAVVLGPVGNTQALGGLTVTAPQLTLNGNIQVNGGGAVDFRNVAAVVFAPNTLIDTDGPGGATSAGGIFFGAGSTLNPTSTAPNTTLTLDASADGGGAAGPVSLGTVGNLVPVALLTVTGDLVSVNGNAAASQVFITADAVQTDPLNGIITATRPFTDTNDANAALTLRGLTTEGIFGTAPPPDTNAIRVAVPGLFVVLPNTNRNSPIVWLRGDPATPPLYAFANNPNRRIVCYNNGCSGGLTDAALIALVEGSARRSALAAILDELRRLLDEALMAGFAKENVRRQLVRGLVLETGRARPGIDEFTGDGVAPPPACAPAAGDAAGGVLRCEGTK